MKSTEPKCTSVSSSSISILMNIFLWLCVCSFVTISRITLHHCRSLVWALSHAHSLPRPLLLMGMLTHLQPGCSVEMQKARLLLVLLVLCIYDCTAIYSPGTPCHRLPSNHLQFHKCWVLRKFQLGKRTAGSLGNLKRRYLCWYIHIQALLGQYPP